MLCLLYKLYNEWLYSFTYCVLKELFFLMFNSQLGTKVTNDLQAIYEMTEIAGHEDRFFKVSNYATLENILSSLEKSIIGSKGKPQYL